MTPNPYMGAQAQRRNLIQRYRVQSRALANPPQILVPASATVLSMVGLNYNASDYMPQALQGRFSSGSYTMIPVRYPASMDATSISTGENNLDIALKGTAGQIIVFAHSQAAQVASRWIRDHYSDSLAPPPSRLTFVLIGNPLRATGGAGIGHLEFDGLTGLATLTQSPWPIVDVARRYDGFADPVNLSSYFWATQNTLHGKGTQHTNYAGVNLLDPTNTIWAIDNTTFVLTYEPLPPVISSWLLTGDQGTAVKSAFRRHVELAYTNRPSHDPTVAISPPLNSYWQFMLGLLGVL